MSTAGREPIRAPLQGAFWPHLYRAKALGYYVAPFHGVHCPLPLITTSLHVAGFEDEVPREGKALPWCHLLSHLTRAESPIVEYDDVCDTRSDR